MQLLSADGRLGELLTLLDVTNSAERIMLADLAEDEGRSDLAGALRSVYMLRHHGTQLYLLKSHHDYLEWITCQVALSFAVPPQIYFPRKTS